MKLLDLFIQILFLIMPIIFVNCFKFYIYFLFRIHLPGKVHDDVSPGSYDCDKGEFKFILIKCVEGQYFSDLDLIGKLLNPKKTNLRPEIRLCNDGK